MTSSFSGEAEDSSIISGSSTGSSTVFEAIFSDYFGAGVSIIVSTSASKSFSATSYSFSLLTTSYSLSVLTTSLSFLLIVTTSSSFSALGTSFILSSIDSSTTGSTSSSLTIFFLGLIEDALFLVVAGFFADFLAKKFYGTVEGGGRG